MSFIRHRRATSPNKFECRNYDSKKNFFDTSALFCWQAINHSYYVQQLSDNNVGFCQDTKGIELIRDAILGDWNNKYKAILEPFLKRMPDKTFHYVASYMLKGYAMEKKGMVALLP